MTNVDRFSDQRYLVLETYRKNGVGVQTPVGFVQDGTTLIIRTQIQSGKAKRMRANPTVRIAPGTARGETTGAWQDATAQELANPAAAHTSTLFSARYGFIWWLFEVVSPWFQRTKGARMDRLPPHDPIIDVVSTVHHGASWVVARSSTGERGPACRGR